VNTASESSKTVANHYISLRDIPPNNVFYVEWKGGLELCNARFFRSVVLLPALKAIGERGLAAQIDYLVYSSDFPWRVGFQPLFPDDEFPENFPPYGSVTGVTYLAPYLAPEEANPAIVMPNVNWYVPQLNDKNLHHCEQIGSVPSRGFRSRYLWDKSGERTDDPKNGQRYLLSAILGVTRGRANTVQEVIHYLTRAKAADGTRPQGTIYFMRNGDVRSRVRHGCFDEIAAAISRQGVQARVLQGTIPTGAKDVAGIMAGTERFNMAASGNVILPGAICEHLTSAGGILSTAGYQTPLSDFLRAGAAGASGTVYEPRDLQAKFPLPSMQLHYIRGCSLAEAFYQSVSGPYQLLIVGDPLCQPWATFPTVSIEGLKPNETVQGTITLALRGQGAGGKSMGPLELMVDGRLVARAPAGASLTLNTAKLADGYHELRVVGAHADPIETQGRAIVPFTVNNSSRLLKLDVSPAGQVQSDGFVRVTVHQPGASAIVIRQNSRQIARVEGESGTVEISAGSLGTGPTTLRAMSEGPAPAASAPVALHVR
jgi:uncharacterized protein (TIGR03790 family)